MFQLTFSHILIATMAWLIRSSISAQVSGIVVGGGGNGKLVGQIFYVLGYVGDG